MFIDDFRENKGKENTNMSEKHRLIASWTCPSWDRTCNLGMCPDWESNLQYFGIWEDTPSNWATWLGLTGDLINLFFNGGILMQANQSKTVSSTKKLYMDMCLWRFGVFFPVQFITDFLKSRNYFNSFDYNELHL